MPSTLYAAKGSVYKSTDDATSWSAANAGLSGRFAPVLGLVIDPTTPTTLYVGMFQGGVFKSIDGGGTWAASGLAGNPVNVLAIDPTTTTTLYAGMGFGGALNGVFKSTDGGSRWSPFNTGLGMEHSCTLVALAIDPTNTAKLYAGTNCSVFAIEQATVCAGDCNMDGQVTVDELLAMVNIALGSADIASCPAGDANHDNQITIDEIIAAVHNALNGCPVGAAPTPTPTPTPRACVTPISNTFQVWNCSSRPCIDFAASNDCCWVATSPDLTITSGSSGCGNGTVCVEGVDCRCQAGDCGEYTISVGGQMYTIMGTEPTLTATPSPSD